MNPNIPRYLQIEGSRDLLRDTHTMGVLNVNRQALEAAKRRKAAVLRQLATEQRKDTEINNLRRDVTELKKLVGQLLAARQTL